MKRLLIAAATAAAITTPAFAADVGISIGVGQPGFYGRIDIGDFPHPQVINREPVAIERVPRDRPPIYLHVPPGYEKHWRRHCHEYKACGERVFFVHDDWYNREYVPRYRARHPELREERKEERHDERREERRDGQ